METLKEKTTKGLFWGGLSNGVQQLIGLVFGIILGRLLSQSDYGMIAMISIFSLVASALQNSGFTVALGNLKEPTHNDYNSVFWFNIVIGSSIYIILFFSAPLIAWYYHLPELVPLCRYAFIGFLFSSWGTAQAAFLFKNLKVKQQAKTGMTAVLISSIIGAIMAWKGFSYWSLATQTIVFAGVNTVLLWHYSSWRPTFQIDFGPVRRMFKFSCKILLSTILTNINNNILNILLGHYFTARDTGHYSQAYQWNSKALLLIQGMLSPVTQPVLVSISDDQERQIRVFRKIIRFTAFISFPLLLGFGLIAREFIVIAITAKWIGSVKLLQLLCISGGFMPLITILSNMVITKGKSNIFMWCSFALGVCEIILMICIYHYGIQKMVTGYVIINIIWVFVWHFFVRRLTGYSLKSFLADFMPFFLTAITVMVITYFITVSITNLIVLLISRIIIASVLYYVIMKIARVQILDDCIQFILKKK